MTLIGVAAWLMLILINSIVHLDHVGYHDIIALEITKMNKILKNVECEFNKRSLLS